MYFFARGFKKWLSYSDTRNTSFSNLRQRPNLFKQIHQKTLQSSQKQLVALKTIRATSWVKWTNAYPNGKWVSSVAVPFKEKRTKTEELCNYLLIWLIGVFSYSDIFIQCGCLIS